MSLSVSEQHHSHNGRISFAGFFSLENLLLAGAIILTVVHTAYTFYFPYLIHDVALYITMGQKIASGAIPYVDVIDTNPPMIMYLSTIPALISKYFATPLAMTALVFFLGLVFSLGFGFLCAVKLAFPNVKRSALYTIWILWIWASFWVYQEGIYAEREQFIYVFMAGFILIRKARYEGLALKPAQAIPFAVLAAIGMGMKPHYVLPWLGVELFFIMFYRKVRAPLFSPEIGALVASGILYLGHFFLAPGMSSYYTYWIPLFSKGYMVFDANWSELFNPLLFTRLGILWLIGGLALIAIIYRTKKEEQTSFPIAPAAFFVFGFLCLIVYVLQKKGWFYQSVGFHLAIITTSSLILADLFQTSFANKTKNLIAAGFLSIMLFTLASPILAITNKLITARDTWLQTPTGPYTDLIANLTKPDESVMFLTTSVGNVYPAITYTGRVNASRFGMAVPLAIILSNASKNGVSPEWGKDEQIYYTGVTQDIEKFSPRAVMVSNSREDVANIAVVRYFQKRDFFATTLKSYTCVGKIDNFLVYLLLPQPESPDYDFYQSGVYRLYEKRVLGSYPPECSIKEK